MPMCDAHSRISGAAVDDSFLCPLCEIDKLRAELTILRNQAASMNLYRVECKGMTSAVVGTPEGIAYVLASDPAEAYDKLRVRLDKKDMGFRTDRALDKIALIAEPGDVPECRMRLIR